MVVSVRSHGPSNELHYGLKLKLYNSFRIENLHLSNVEVKNLWSCISINHVP